MQSGLWYGLGQEYYVFAKLGQWYILRIIKYKYKNILGMPLIALFKNR